MKFQECPVHNIKYNKETTKECPDCVEDERKATKVSPAQAGYYRAIIATKIEENKRVKETRDWLYEQVKFLRKSIAFLEARKRQLEEGIKMLERNIGLGIDIMENLEDDPKFIEASKNEDNT